MHTCMSAINVLNPSGCHGDKVRCSWSVCLCDRRKKKSVLPVAMEMHAAHGGCVSVQRVDTLAALGVPHTQRPVGGAADHRGNGHLTAPHATSVTRQCAQTLRERDEQDVRIFKQSFQLFVSVHN